MLRLKDSLLVIIPLWILGLRKIRDIEVGDKISLQST